MTKTFKNLALALSLSAAFAAPAAAQRINPVAIAVVDTDRILRECTACVAAQAQLQTQLTQLQQRQQQLAQPLQTEGQQLQAQIQALQGKQPDAALQQRIQSLQTRQTQANEELGRGEQNIRSIQAHVVQQINQRLRPILDGVIASRSVGAVLERGSLLAVSPAIDITNDVLAQLNQQLPSVSVTPLPQPQQPAQQQPQGR